MKKPALKIVLALALCFALLFSFAAVAQAKTASPNIIAYSVYSSAGTYTHSTSFTVYADKVWEPNGLPIADVQFSIWTKSDKSDLKTFSGTRDNDNWRVLINTWQFDNAYGKYRVYAYGIDTAGRKALVGGVTVTVAPENITSTATDFYTSVPKNGAFYTYVKGATNDADDVAKINLRVWANGLESTEKWYPMQNMGKGTWRVQVNISDFAFYHGWYTLKAYTVNSVGAQSYVSTIYVQVP